MIRAILACDSEGGIGLKGKMPWPRNKVDLAHFYRLTKRHIVVMGRKTWEAPDMPSPLPDRTNLVVSNQKLPGVTTIQPSIIPKLKGQIFIIGGALLFNSMINHIEVLNLTQFDGDWGCDTKINLTNILYDFILIEDVPYGNLTFKTYIRRT